MFKRSCGICRVLMTADGANKPGSDPPFLKCKYHPKPDSQARASSWERKARGMVEQVAADSVVATESKVLGKLGTIDLLFPVRQPGSSCIKWVAVEVDGAAHFEKPWKNSSQLVRRQQDREKDAAAWRANQRVVRLHHGDSELWPAALEAAKRLAEVEQLCSYCLYTPSYAEHECTSRVKHSHGSEEELSWSQVGGWAHRPCLAAAPALAVGDPVGPQHSQQPVHSIQEVKLGIGEAVCLEPLVPDFPALAPPAPAPPADVDCREGYGSAEEGVLVHKDVGLPVF